jgi:hypothetical protein
MYSPWLVSVARGRRVETQLRPGQIPGDKFFAHRAVRGFDHDVGVFYQLEMFPPEPFFDFIEHRRGF